MSIKSLTNEGPPVNMDDIDFSGGVSKKNSMDESEIIVKPKRKYNRRKK